MSNEEITTTPEQDKEILKIIEATFNKVAYFIKGSSVQIFVTATHGKNKQEYKDANTVALLQMSPAILEQTLYAMCKDSETFAEAFKSVATIICLEEYKRGN